MAVVPLRRRGWSWRDIGLFWTSAVLIDVDHYLSYVWRYHDLSLPHAYDFHRNSVPRGGAWNVKLHAPNFWPGDHRPFHAVVFLLALWLLSRRVPLLRPVACGAVFHRLQDYAWETVTHTEHVSAG